MAIDLSALDDDGNPEMSAVATVGARAFVALERLDPNYRSVKLGMIAVIDTERRALTGTVTLQGRNPFGVFAVDGEMLWMAEPGNFDVQGEQNAGVERFDPSTQTSTIMFPESRIPGASVAEVAVSNGCVVAILADAVPNVNHTWAAVLDTGTPKRILPLLDPTTGFDLQGLYMSEKALFIGDRRKTDFGYAVHIFDRNGCNFTAKAQAFLTLPPVAFRKP